VVGGTQNLTRALIRCIEHHGGEVRVDTPVTKVLVRGGKAYAVRLADGTQIAARRAIVGGIHPYHLADLVENLPQQVGRDASRAELSSFAGFMIHCALHEPPQWHVGRAPDNCLNVNMVDYTGMEEFRRSFDALKYGELPHHFSGYTSCSTLFAATRAPPGKHTLYFLSSVPYQLKDGGAARWDEIKEQHADWRIEQLRRYCGNVDATNIQARYVETPLDMERHTPSFPRGDMVGLASFIYQFFGQRPTPALAQYRVPGAQGLYLAGPFMHPGGGLTGGGRPVAIRILEDLGLPYHSVISR
jgi:phytoene dehydrogenase-like protein